jgi:hypothetical protein
MDRLRKRRQGDIARTASVEDCGQSTWRDERKRRKKANVPFHFALALCDLGERLNAVRYEVVDPGARLGDGEENRACRSSVGLALRRGEPTGNRQRSIL